MRPDDLARLHGVDAVADVVFLEWRVARLKRQINRARAAADRRKARIAGRWERHMARRLRREKFLYRASQALAWLCRLCPSAFVSVRHGAALSSRDSHRITAPASMELRAPRFPAAHVETCP